MVDQLGENQFGERHIGSVEDEEAIDFAETFEELQESAAPAGPPTPADRMYSHIKPAFQARDNEKWQALVESFAEEFEQLADARQEVVISRYVETAFGQQLDRIGKFVQTPRKTDENDASYRARLIVEFKKITAGGTIDDFLEVSEVLLETDASNITIDEPFDTEPARVDISIPDKLIEEADFTIGEYADYLREIKAAGVRLRGVMLGGFTHRSEEDYMNGVNDISKSYNESDYAGLF